jgi:hypothetical protein
MQRSVHTHARTQFTEQALPGGARHDLTYGEVRPLRVFLVEKRRRDEDFIGHFDFDTGCTQTSHIVNLYYYWYTNQS